MKLNAANERFLKIIDSVRESQLVLPYQKHPLVFNAWSCIPAACKLSKNLINRYFSRNTYFKGLLWMDTFVSYNSVKRWIKINLYFNLAKSFRKPGDYFTTFQIAWMKCKSMWMKSMRVKSIRLKSIWMKSMRMKNIRKESKWMKSVRMKSVHMESVHSLVLNRGGVGIVWGLIKI